MHTPSQWIHQNDFVLTGATVLVGLALLLVYRRSSILWWVAWAGGLSLYLAALLALRTPDATIISAPDLSTRGIPDATAGETIDSGYKELELRDIEAIEHAIQSAGKPVLVEIYSDFGFS
jgi:hypothetical protein